MSSTVPSAVRAAAAATFLILGPAPGSRVAHGQELPSPLPLPELLDAVRRRSPVAREWRKLAGAAALRPRAEGLPPDPMAMLEWWQQPVDFSTVPLMLTLKQAIPWPGSLRLRRELAEREAAAVRDGADEVARRVETDAKRTYFDLALAERSLEINDRTRVILEHLVAVTDAQYRVGRAAQADLFKARSELLMVENDRLDLERGRDEAVARLNALLDRPVEAPLGPTATAPAMVTLPPLDELAARALERRPEVRRARDALAAAETRSALARKESLPELSAWAGYMINLRGVDTFTLGLSTTLPIFSSIRRRPLTGAAEAEVEAARAALSALRRQTEAEIRSSLLRLETAARHVRLHADKLIPLADVTLQSAEAGYQAGRVDFPSVLEAARAVRDHHLSHVVFLVEYRRRLADLEQLVGADLDGSGGAP